MKTLLRALFGNLPLKFAALAFAFGIWTAVRMNVEVNPIVTFQVVAQVADSRYVPTVSVPANGRVSIELVGSRDVVADFLAGEDLQTLIVEVSENQLRDEPADRTFPFRRGDVRLPRNAPPGLKIGAMDPPEISLHVVRVDQKADISIRTPELRGAEEITEASFRIADFTPTLVARGRWELLKDVSSVNAFVSEKTLRELVNRLGSQTSHSYSGVPIELIPDNDNTAGWRDEFEIVEPQEIVAKIEVTSEVEREFWVPIHIDYRGKDSQADGVLRFVAEAAGPNRWTESTGPDSPPKVLLPFAGSPREIARFQDLVDKGQVTAFVLANDVNADDGFANLRVRIEMSGNWKGVTPRYAKFPLVGVETIK